MNKVNELNDQIIKKQSELIKELKQALKTQKEYINFLENISTKLN